MDILITLGMTLPEVSPEQLARITAAAGPDAKVTLARGREEALDHVAEAEVILGFLSPRLFAAAKKLRWVHATASGVDGYLSREFRESDVILTGEKGLVGGHLADHAFALLLALTRKLATAVRLGADSWNQRMDMRRVEIELEGLSMGIVGFGGSGRAIARRAAAFGMCCRAVDRDAVEGSVEVSEVGSMESFTELLASSDVVSICCPLTTETRDLFGERAFASMKPTAILLNVTRGEIVDGDALVHALEQGQIAGAGLDVAPEEPLPPDHPLWTLDNVVMTPHTAGASQLRAGRNIDRFCENLQRLRRGEPLLGSIDKQTGY
ncbi:MAG: D-2-hydroxyacid dehydrogenase [Myxococcota bacterium]